MIAAIEHCLRADPGAQPIETVAQWWPGWVELRARHAAPIECAIASGFAADRLAWAFAGGFQAALRALLPALPNDQLTALCITEETGNRPRDIQTTITQRADGSLSISGAKRWSTLGLDSDVLLVVGRMAGGSEGERQQFQVARVPSGSAGLTLQPMPPTRFVPEVAHAQVTLDDVRLPASALLPGDAYESCVKPFRTIEDTYVTAGVLAYLLREARARAWPATLRERLVAVLATLASLATAPNDPATHVALEGALQWIHQLYEEAGALWATAADEAAARWQRDSGLFKVAGTARVLRAARAWERLAQSG